MRRQPWKRATTLSSLKDQSLTSDTVTCVIMTSLRKKKRVSSWNASGHNVVPTLMPIFERRLPSISRRAFGRCTWCTPFCKTAWRSGPVQAVPLPAAQIFSLLTASPSLRLFSPLPAAVEMLSLIPHKRGSGLPDDQMKLRLLNAIDEKLKKYHRYRETGVLSSEDRYVIAVSGSAIGMARHELPIPRIVRDVFGLGNEQVHIDLESGRKDEWSWSSQEVVNKKSGSPVDSKLFLSSKSAPISAVMYCFTDECNRPPNPGVDFLTVHNPSASNKLARGFFPFGREYWLEGDQLKWRNGPICSEEST